MNLVWFRSDLRITDNSALWKAINSGETIGCCLLPINQWQNYGLGNKKTAFVKASAEELKNNLATLKIPLLIVEVDSFEEQVQELKNICNDHKIQNVFWNNEYPLDERNRDQAAHNQLEGLGIQCHRSSDALIMPPGSVITQQGDIYKVFTPFKRSWIAQVEGHSIDLVTANNFEPANIKDDELIRPGESAALASVKAFVKEHISLYKDKRDIPNEAATSSLSAHLSAGTISPRNCLKLALEANGFELSVGNPGITTWISQLIWREFYYHLIATQNRLSRFQPFKKKTNRIIWNDPGIAFQRWKDGMTGVPIVDAGMRQLNTTGWMHNRVRMITAMYLTKNLFIDWRLGEKYFLGKLVDADFALNNGGWQWSASTGTDAAPYFRVFNPFNQAKRFDPKASYIKRYVAELEETPEIALHDEKKLEAAKPSNYPAPVIDTKTSRAAAISKFKPL